MPAYILPACNPTGAAIDAVELFGTRISLTQPNPTPTNQQKNPALAGLLNMNGYQEQSILVPTA